MNIVLFDKKQVSEGRFVVGGERFEHITQVLKAQVGSKIRIGEIGGRIGQGIVEQINAGSVVIQFENLTEVPPAPAVDIILALPRPQMLKRIFENCPSLGVRRLFLIRSERVERSFFHTPALKAEMIRDRLIIGAEQGVVTCLPEVYIYSRFREFIDERLDHLVASAQTSIIAHPGGCNMIGACQSGMIFPVVAAIGPEGGWMEHEVEIFERKGFCRVSLGPRILRVETAVYSLLANLSTINEYHQK